MTQLPSRSRRYGVGKEIAGRVYVHRQYEGVLGETVERAKVYIPEGFNYQVVRSNWLDGSVAFVESPDFDTADEPVVGRILTVTIDGTLRHRTQSADPEIYHHKWLFVQEDYPGFDVAASRRRSASWYGIIGIDRSCIGRQSYWTEYVLPLIDTQ